MKTAFNNTWKWFLVGLLGLLGFSSCEKPEPDMYGPLPYVYMYGPLPGSYYTMYGPPTTSYETRAPQGNPAEELAETETPVVESPEEE